MRFHARYVCYRVVIRTVCSGIVGLAALAACAKPNALTVAAPTPTSSPTSSPTPTPTPTPTPGAVVLSSSSLAFTGAGGANARTVTATQTNYAGAFTAATAPTGQPNACGGIATIAASGGATFTVTPSASGTCSFSIAGGGGQSATLSVVITITTVGGS
jgi:hypothetical protein